MDLLCHSFGKFDNYKNSWLWRIHRWHNLRTRTSTNIVKFSGSWLHDESIHKERAARFITLLHAMLPDLAIARPKKTPKTLPKKSSAALKFRFLEWFNPFVHFSTLRFSHFFFTKCKPDGKWSTRGHRVRKRNFEQLFLRIFLRPMLYSACAFSSILLAK